MKKVYLAGGISDTARKLYQVDTAEKLDPKYEVYAAGRNDSINDKSNNPTPKQIYQADVSEVINADIILAILSGGNEVGTVYELGLASGWSEAVLSEIMFLREVVVSDNPKELVEERLGTLKPKKILAYSTNERMSQPQFYKGIPSGGYNHLVLGGIDRWGKFLGRESDMLMYMMELGGEDIGA